MSQNKILEDKYFKITINGDIWNVYLIEEDDHSILEDGEYGETDFDKKEIYIRKTTQQIVTHELIHAFVYYTYTNTCTLSALQNEELCAEVISWNWDKISLLRDEVYKGLQKLKEDK